MAVNGLLCLDSDQNGGTCSDYETRFCCPNPVVTNLVAGTCPTGQWSAWFDTMDPSAAGGDIEMMDSHIQNIFSTICQNPTGAQGRIVGAPDINGEPDTTTMQERVTMSRFGLMCMSMHQNGNCEDYEVRFCCPDPIDAVFNWVHISVRFFLFKIGLILKLKVCSSFCFMKFFGKYAKNRTWKLGI